ncbi:hypothetical protein [Ruegeria atlantica]|uniref:hypothetical protein n=1 Tax=Ruegeria atlantica TaxID=81569 RepID=UPI00147EA8B9|nr:hypothetical protein [Ruegeria atlantica]
MNKILSTGTPEPRPNYAPNVAWKESRWSPAGYLFRYGRADGTAYLMVTDKAAGDLLICTARQDGREMVTEWAIEPPKNARKTITQHLNAHFQAMLGGRI